MTTPRLYARRSRWNVLVASLSLPCVVGGQRDKLDQLFVPDASYSKHDSCEYSPSERPLTALSW